MIRFIRAFFIALRMTLRGETIAPQRPMLRAWIQQANRLLDTVYATADKHGFKIQRRATLTLMIDRRDISMETILAGVRHNLTREYPYLLRQPDNRQNLNAIYATNMNDQFRVQRLADADIVDSPPVQTAITALANHLAAIPPAEADE